jgi:hypothetical protein
MGSLPKPLIGLLLGTVAFFALWMVALKPHSSSSNGGSQGGVGQYQSAINQAHGAVTTSNQANAKLGAPTATTAAPASPAKTATTAAPASSAKTATTTTTNAAPATKAKATTGAQSAAAEASRAVKSGASAQVTTSELVLIVQDAIREHKVLAILFFNPAAADDRAVAAELAQVTRPNPKVIGVVAPVSELTKFEVITTKVQVDTSPTLVFVDAKGRASTLTGYSGKGEISQRINDALAAK